jgi:hypothetical protein
MPRHDPFLKTEPVIADEPAEVRERPPQIIEEEEEDVYEARS